MGSRVQPRKAPAHDLHGELFAFHINPVDIGDFEFTARRWPQGGCDVEHAIVIEIKSGNRQARTWLCWFFLDR